MKDHDKFGESVEDLCTVLITNVECIIHDNETRRTQLKQQMEETAKSFQKYFYLMVDD